MLVDTEVNQVSPGAKTPDNVDIASTIARIVLGIGMRLRSAFDIVPRSLVDSCYIRHRLQKGADETGSEA